MKAVADLKEFTTNANTAAERYEKAALLMADVEKAREKNRVVQQAPQPDPSAFGSLSDLVMSTPEKLSNEWEREVHKTFWELKQVDSVFRLATQVGKASYSDPKGLKLGRKFDRLLRQKSDNWDTLTPGAGGDATVGLQDWVSVLYSSQFVDFYQLPAKVAQVFPRVEMPMGSGSVRVPVATSANAVTLVPEQQTVATTFLQATTGPDTDFLELTAKKHRAGTAMSWEFTEDSVVNAMAYAQAAIRKQLALALDSSIINGQTTNLATLDGATNGPQAANGYGNTLRVFAHVTNAGVPPAVPLGNQIDAGGAPLDSGLVAAARRIMGKFGVFPSEVVLLVSPKGYLDLVADADDRVITLEKYGSAATILTGELARVFGIPVVVTDQISELLGADGDAAIPGNNTIALMVNHTRWYLGIKRDIEVRVVPNPVADQIGIYGFMRSAFNFAPPTSDDIVVEIFELAA